MSDTNNIYLSNPHLLWKHNSSDDEPQKMEENLTDPPVTEEQDDAEMTEHDATPVLDDAPVEPEQTADEDMPIEPEQAADEDTPIDSEQTADEDSPLDSEQIADEDAEVVDSLDEVVREETLSNPYLLWKHNSPDVKPNEMAATPVDEKPIEAKPEEKKAEEQKPKKATISPEKSATSPANVATGEKKADKKPAPVTETMEGKRVGLMALISIILFIGSFIPLAKVKTNYNEYDYSTYSVSYSPLDFASFGVSIIKSNFVATTVTDEYYDFQSLRRTVQTYDTSSHLSEQKVKNLSEYTKESFRITFMNNRAPTKANVAAVSALSFAYIIISFVLIICSLVMVASADNAIKMYMLYKKLSYMLVSALPFYLLVMLRTSRFNYGGVVSNYGDAGASYTFYAVVLFILVAAIVAFKLIGNRGYLTKKSMSSRDRTEKRRVLALICLAVAVVAMFLPFVVVKTATYSGTYIFKKSLFINARDVYEFATSEISYFDKNMQPADLEEFIRYVRNVASGYSTNVPAGTDIFNRVIFDYCYDADVLYTFSGIFSAVSLLLISLLFAKVLRAIEDQTQVKKQGRVMIFSVACVLAYLIFGISMAGVCNMNTPWQIDTYLRFSVGIGPILALVFLVAAIVILSLKDKKKAAREYDNPDVSYDPYIV